MKNIIISGINSQISRHLVDVFIENGYKIFGLYRNENKICDLKNIKNLELIKIDLENILMLTEILGNKSNYAFFHIAWESANESRYDYTKQYKNMLYSANALKVAKKIGCEIFIQPSSVSELSILKQIKISDLSSDFTQDVYSNIKFLSRMNCKILSNLIGINFYSLMTALPYGEYQKDGFIKNVIKKMLKNEDINLVPRDYPLDLIYARDYARAFLYVLQANSLLTHPTYSLRTYGEYFDDIKEILNSTSKIHYSSYDGCKFEYNVDTNLSNYGFKCETKLSDGIIKTAQWIEKNEM